MRNIVSCLFKNSEKRADGLQSDIGVIQDVAQIDAVDERLDGIALERGQPNELLHAARNEPRQIAHHDDAKLPAFQLFAAHDDALVLGNDLPHALAR